MTAKQRRAALRNLRKARAAIGKGKGIKGKLCFESIKSTANFLKRHGYKVVHR